MTKKLQTKEEIVNWLNKKIDELGDTVATLYDQIQAITEDPDGGPDTTDLWVDHDSKEAMQIAYLNLLGQIEK